MSRFRHEGGTSPPFSSPANGEGHPGLEDLAALACGSLPREREAVVREHLVSCDSCLGAYAEAIESRIHPPPEAVPAEILALAAHGPSLPSRRDSRASSAARHASPSVGGAVGLVARAASIAAALAAVVFALWTWNAAKDPRRLGGVDLDPLRASARAMSSYLPDHLVVPGGEAWAGRVESSVVRSGAAAAPGTAETVTALAAREVRGEAERAEASLWLGIGYLALDDLTSARIQLESALQAAPEREDLLIAASIRAHRAGERSTAEDLLRRTVALHPRSVVARLDLGIVLASDPARREESLRLLGPIASGHRGPLATRARLVLDELRATE